MAKVIKETPINDDISVVILKNPGEAPYTQVVASKLNRIKKLYRYVETNHGGKREKYQLQLDTLLEQYKQELNNS